MFRLSARQFAALQDMTRASFMRRLREHLRGAPGMSALSEADLEEFIRLGVQRAQGHGLTSQRQVALYLTLMALLGAGFDSDPQLPWVRTILADRIIAHPTERVEWLTRVTLRYLNHVHGEDDRHFQEALTRSRQFNHARWLRLHQPEEGLEQALLRLARWLFPTKYVSLKEAGWQQVAADCIQSGEEHGLCCGYDMAEHMISRLLLGSRYLEDPRYAQLGALGNVAEWLQAGRRGRADG
jgi:hypothetical protein